MMNKYSTYELYADGVHTKLGDYKTSCKQIKNLFCGRQLSLSLFINCKVKCCYKFFRFFVHCKVQIKRWTATFSVLW
jgi:hypothetical protein